MLVEVTTGLPAILAGGARWSMGSPIIPGSDIAPITSGAGTLIDPLSGSNVPEGDFELIYGKPGDPNLYRVLAYDFGGVIPGGDHGNPIMPDGSGQVHNRWNNHGEGGEPKWTQWQFVNAGGAVDGDGAWYDPFPMVPAYLYEITDGISHFVRVELPFDIPAGVSYDMYWIRYDDGLGAGGDLGASLGAGDIFDFPGVGPDGVSWFVISGIEDPGADSSAGDGFPTWLVFDSTGVSFTMTGIPEPTTMGLMLFGAVGMIARKRRR